MPVAFATYDHKTSPLMCNGIRAVGWIGGWFHYHKVRAEYFQPLHKFLRDDRLTFTLRLAEFASLAGSGACVGGRIALL